MLESFFKPRVYTQIKRFGPDSDGGYYAPKKLVKITENLICCGLGNNRKFEKDFYSYNKKSKIEIYDHTINYLSLFFDLIKSTFFSFRYRKDFAEIFKFFDYIIFFNKPNVNHHKFKVQNTSKFKNEISLSKILEKKKSIFLKLDIEGDEYKILDTINFYQKNIICLIIEFHNIHIKKNKKKIQKFIKNIKLKNCNICPNNSGGVHKNNPKVVEITFINEDFVNTKKNFLSNDSKCLKNNFFKKDIKIKFSK